MKNTKTLKLLSIVLVLALVAGYLSVFGGIQTAFADVGNYYSGITASGGEALLGQLHDLITTTHKKYTSYNDCKNPSIIKKTDAGTNGNVMEFYTQDDIASTWGGGKIGTWNREHVWCQSLSGGLWGTSGGGSDLHHIRPAESGLNSTRGNNKYGIVDGGKEAVNKDSGNVGGHYASNVFEPLDNVKGDVARIVMYVYTHYNKYENVGGTTNGSGSASFGNLKFTMVVSAYDEASAIRMLLQWSKLDPVDDIERTRNEEVYKIQGNRNPFIDDPTYADRIWSDQAVDIDLEGIIVTPDEMNVTIGQSKKLTATAVPAGADGRVTWTSSDVNVATVSSTGVVTAKSEGTCVITATSLKDPTCSDMAIVNVSASGGGDIGEVGHVEITKASFDMTTGYGFKYWQSGGIGGMAFVYGGSSAYAPNGMQFNVSQSSYYIASNVALPGAIKSVTVKMVNAEADRPWKLLTSDTPYGEVAKKPTNGNDHGTQTVTDQGVTWEVDGNDTYFALTYELNSTKGVCYLDSIVIEYEGGSQTEEPTPVSVECVPDDVELQETQATIENLRDLLTVNLIMSDNSEAESLDYEIIGYDPTVFIPQTVTIKVGELTTTITVTVFKEGDIPEPASIECTPNKVELGEGDSTIEDLRGLLTVKLIMSDNSEVESLDYEIIGYDPTVFTPQTVTIKVGELTTTITVTVFKQGEIPIAEIIECTPNEIVLESNEASIEGLKSKLTVKVIFDDESWLITDNYTVENFDPTIYTEQIVTIGGWHNATTTIKVTVKQGQQGGDDEKSEITEFVDAVNSISSAETTEDKFNAIKSAIDKYKALSEQDVQSEKVSGAYETLQNAINEYNSLVSSINESSKTATENATATAMIFIPIAAALLAVIKYLL